MGINQVSRNFRLAFFKVIEFISFESLCRRMGKYLDVKNRKRRIVRIAKRLNGNRMSKNRPDCETFEPESYERESSGLQNVWIANRLDLDRLNGNRSCVRFCMKFSPHGRRKKGMVTDFM